MDAQTQTARNDLIGELDFLDRPEPIAQRGQRLWDDILTLCSSWLEESTKRCLDEVERDLAVMALTAYDHESCDGRSISRQFRTQRIGIEQQFTESAIQAFTRLNDGVFYAQDYQFSPKTYLTIDPPLEMTLESAVATCAWRNGAVLYELAHRLAAMLSSPPLTGERLPIGPAILARRWQSLADRIGSSAVGEVMLKAFEYTILGSLDALYETLNDHLQADNVLPHLRSQAPIRRPHGAKAPTLATNNAAPAAASEHGDLMQLRRLLQQRQAAALPAQDPAACRTATPAQLHQALQALQHDTQHWQTASRAPDELACSLHNALLVQLNRRIATDVAPIGLSQEQSQTVELIALLVEALAVQLHPHNAAQPLFDQLPLPLLRLAIDDGEFFASNAHPARGLLEAMTQIAFDWLEGQDNNTDRQVLGKLQWVVQQLNTQPARAALYARMHRELQAHMAVLKRQARLNEEHQVQAMQGREQLELARQHAAAVLSTRLQHSSPNASLRFLLEHAWSDVLALTLLRQGERSEAFIEAVHLTDQLLGRMPAPDWPQVLRQVEAGLAGLGLAEAEARQIASLLSEQGDARAAAEAHRRDEAEHHQSQAAHPSVSASSQATDRPGPASAGTAQALDELETNVLRRLQELPFGTWFEFRDSATARLERRKLAWYSPRTGRSLLIDRHGAHSPGVDLPQLAGAIAQGKASELGHVRPNIFERAWQRISLQLGYPPTVVPRDRVGLRA